MDDSFTCVGMHRIGNGYTPKNAFTQRLNDFTAFNQRLDSQAIGRAAVVLCDHQILRDVDETTCQVARVGRFQCRISQTFTRTVCRDEVLQHIQAFAEVRRDRRLDNRAVWLGHQAAHASKLTNLRRRAAGARIRHHVNSVE